MPRPHNASPLRAPPRSGRAGRLCAAALGVALAMAAGGAHAAEPGPPAAATPATPTPTPTPSPGSPPSATPAPPAPSTPEPAPGSLRVVLEGLPEGASFTVDGAPRAFGDRALDQLAPGPHTVALALDGVVLATREVTVRSGTTTALAPAPGPPGAGALWVRVTPAVPGAVVEVDGEGAGPVGAWLTGLEPGARVVTVRAPGYFTFRRDAVVDAGRTAVVEATLRPAGELEVRLEDEADPTPAEVLLDGAFVGTTPWREPVAAGDYTLTVRRAGDFAQDEPISVAQAATTTVVARPFRPVRAPSRSTRGGFALARGTAALDLTTGWPFSLSAHFTGGLTEAIDLGIGVRSAFSTLTELDLRGRFMVTRTAVIGAALVLDVEAGLGRDERNSFAVTPALAFSAQLGERVVVSASAGVRLFTDRTGPSAEAAHSARDGGVQLPLAIACEVVLSKHWNALARLEGNPLSGARRLYEVDHLDNSHVGFELGVSWIF